jgi:hypothetical protein
VITGKVGAARTYTNNSLVDVVGMEWDSMFPTERYTLTLTGGGLSSVPVAGAGAIDKDTTVIVTIAVPAGKQVAIFTVGGADKKDEIVVDTNTNTYTYTFTITANTEVAVTYVDNTAAKTLAVFNGSVPTLLNSSEDHLSITVPANNYSSIVSSYIWTASPDTNEYKWFNDPASLRIKRSNEDTLTVTLTLKIVVDGVEATKSYTITVHKKGDTGVDLITPIP